MRVLGFGTYDLTTHPRFGVLLAGLRASGVVVEEINEPLGLETAARVAILRQPWRLPKLLLRLLRCWVVLARRAHRTAPPDAVLVGYLGHFDVLLARVLFRRTPIALDFLISASDTARDRGEYGRPKAQLLRWLDAAALGAADVVACDTEEHAAALPQRFRAKAVVALVGAPGEWFAAGATRAAPDPSRALRVVFFGLFTPLQGAPTIGAALARLHQRADVEVTMIGGGQELAAARRAAAGNSRVTWRDWVPSSQLPALVASFDVCLGIFGTGPKAQRVVPNKVFQGAAAGCAVVTSDTAPQRRALGEVARFVPPGDASALAVTLAALADDRSELAARQRAARNLAESAFTPDLVTRPVVTRLAGLVAGLTVDRHRPTVPPHPPLPCNAWLRWDVVSRLLDRAGPFHSVLEVGCGQGAVGVRLAERGAYTGVEPDSSSAAVARGRLAGRGRVIDGDVSALGVDEQFDLLCAFEVLEHLEDDVGALKQWSEHVRPGGRVLLSVPAWADRYAAWDRRVGHYRRYSPRDIQFVLGRAGLDPVQVVLYGWPLGYLLEAGRNLLARRRVNEALGFRERTTESGRLYQPSSRFWVLVQPATAPFRLLQRAATKRGIGLVVLARVPAGKDL